MIEKVLLTFLIINSIYCNNEEKEEYSKDCPSDLHWLSSMGTAKDIENVLKNEPEKIDNINLKNKNKMTPLCLAANRTTENLEVVQYLTEKGADPILLCSDDNYPAYLFAIKQIYVDTAKFLSPVTSNNIEVRDSEDYSPICFAAKSSNPNSLPLLTFLLDTGSDANDLCGKQEYSDYESFQNDSLKQTPLFLSVMMSYNETLTQEKLKCLLDHQADQEIADWNDWLPIHAAAIKGFKNVTEQLLNSTDRDTQEKILNSEAFFEFAEEDEDETLTPFELASMSNNFILKYYLRFFLQGGEFGRETKEFYSMTADALSSSASYIQQYVDEVSTLNIDKFQDEEGKAIAKEHKLEEDFGKLEEHIKLAGETGVFWRDNVVDNLKSSFFHLRDFGKNFLNSYDSVVKSIKPKDVDKKLKRLEKMLKRRRTPKSRIQFELDRERDRMNRESLDYSHALSEVHVFLEHVKDHAKINEERARKLVKILKEFRSLLVVDRGNFKDDYEFLIRNVTILNREELLEKGKKLVKLTAQFGIIDEELIDLLNLMEANIKEIKEVANTRIALASTNVAISSSKIILSATSMGLNHLGKTVSKNVKDKLKIAGDVATGASIILSGVEIIFSMTLKKNMDKLNAEIKTNHQEYNEKMKDMMQLSYEIMRANRTMINFARTAESQEKATEKLQHLIGILDNSISEADLLVQDWGNIAFKLEGLDLKATVADEKVKEEVFKIVDSQLKQMRDEWASIADSAQSIALVVRSIGLDNKGKEREKRSTEHKLIEPIDIGELSFESENGRQMIDDTEKIYNETMRALFHWKDVTYPLAASTVRDLRRTLLEVNGNIAQLLKVDSRFGKIMDSLNDDIILAENRIELEKYESRKNVLTKKVKNIIQNLLVHEMEEGLFKFIKSAKFTSSELKYSQVMSEKNLQKINDTSEYLLQLRINSRGEISCLFGIAYKMKIRIMELFSSIKHKTERVKELQDALIAMSAFSIGTSVIGRANPAVGIAVSMIELIMMPVQMAFENASDQLQEEMRKETEQYIEMSKLLFEKRVELGKIDLDLETVKSLRKLLNRQKNALEDLIFLGRDHQGLDSIVAQLINIRDMGKISQDELKANKMRFFPIDMNIIQDATAQIFKDVDDLRIVF